MYTEIVINKYPQLLLVLSETNGQKVHQFFGGPKVFFIIMTTCWLLTVKIRKKNLISQKVEISPK